MATVLCVVGPTASGKTKMGVALAQRFNGEVVSVDSMQLYRGMEVGTAAPTHEEMAGIPHHMVGIAEPTENWSVAKYVAEADKQVQDILARGKLPVLVGGTGLYLDSLVRGIDFAAGEQGGELRLKLQERLAKEGAEALLNELRAIDPEAAAKLHLNLDDNERIFRCPVSGKEDNFYAYYGNGLKCAMLGNCPGAIPILACHNHNGTEFVVVYGDGHVMQLDAGKLFSTHENLVRYAFENSSFKGCENKAWEIVLENARTLDRNNRK